MRAASLRTSAFAGDAVVCGIGTDIANCATLIVFKVQIVPVAIPGGVDAFLLLCSRCHHLGVAAFVVRQFMVDGVTALSQRSTEDRSEDRSRVSNNSTINDAQQIIDEVTKVRFGVAHKFGTEMR